MSDNRVSVLMSIYIKEDALYLDKCLESLKNQTLQADEIILVEDGPLTEALYRTIDDWKKVLPVKTVKLDENVGLAKALNIGLEKCQYDFVARMDTDDICKDYRLEVQHKFMLENPDVSVVGSSIEEFKEDADAPYGERKVPTSYSDILEFSKSRNPLNHMTVFFRKKDILEVGGYGNYRFAQDYFLWVKLLNSGKILCNIEESLVWARTNKKLFRRRGGKQYFLYELDMQTKFLKMGHISFIKYCSNLIVRIIVRFLPNKVREVIYKRLFRST